MPLCVHVTNSFASWLLLHVTYDRDKALRSFVSGCSRHLQPRGSSLYVYFFKTTSEIVLLLIFTWLVLPTPQEDFIVPMFLMKKLPHKKNFVSKRDLGSED